MKHITVSTYRKDKYYPRVVRAVGRLLARTDVVAPSEILIEMGNLSKKNYEAWRKEQVPYLERVFEGSLSKANRILRIIGFHVHDLKMIEGQLPRRAISLILEWAFQHRDELMENWERAQRKEAVEKIDPLT